MNWIKSVYLMYHDWVEVKCWTCVRSKMSENKRDGMDIKKESVYYKQM